MKLGRLKAGKFKDHWVLILNKGTVHSRVVVLNGNPADSRRGSGILVPGVDISKAVQVSTSDVSKIDQPACTAQWPIKIWDGQTTLEIPGPKDDARAVIQPARPKSKPRTQAPTSPSGTPHSGTVPPGTKPLKPEVTPTGPDIPVVTLPFLKQMLIGLPIKMAAMIWGPSGVGKSDLIRELALEMGYTVIDLRLYQLDPVDIRGIGVPDLQTGTTRWLPPEFFPRKEKTLLFLDELPSAPPSIQAIGYQLVLDRRIGEIDLPADCKVIAAGNRMSDRGVVYRMPAPLANRFVHFEVKADIDAWRQWAILNSVDARVISYLTLKPNLLHKMSTENSAGPWPSPRSWNFCSQLIQRESIIGETEISMVAACVGVAAARDFQAFCDTLDSPDPLLYLDTEDPKEMEAISGMDAASQNVLALAMSYLARTEAQLKNAMISANYFHPEVSALLLYGLEQRNKPEAIEKYKDQLKFDIEDLRPPTQDELELPEIDLGNVSVSGLASGIAALSDMPLDPDDLDDIPATSSS